VVLVLVAIGGAIAALMFRHEYREYVAARESVVVQEAGPEPSPYHAGSVVHMAVEPAGVRPQRSAYDPGFGLTATGAFTLQREAQFCQWVQTHVDHTTKHSDGTETVTRTYYYSKQWVPTPLISLGYDQPAAHHNPLRNPYPSGTVDQVDVTLNSGFTLPAPLAASVRVEEAPVLHWRPEHLGQFITSPAVAHEKFFYTGNNGWFYSKHEPSTAENMFRTAMMFAEGTLLDFQIGDLFATCTAGDVRVRYRAKLPSGGVSVVAQQVDASGLLGTFRPPQSSKDMALVHEGIHDADTMFLVAAADARFKYRVAAVVTIIDLLILFFVLPKALQQARTKHD
jgi:hypothetical protein